jgi:2'-5' RNA ligase
MRLFFAVPFPSPVSERLADWAQRRPLAGARWTFDAGLHLTLQFLGEVSAGRLAAAREALSALHGPPFEVAVQGLGAFPDERRPRVLWAGVSQGADRLAGLSADLGDVLRAKEFVLEDRAFSAHVTLARFRTPIADLAGRIEADRKTEWGTFPADRVGLFESRLAPGGARHILVQEASL